jgi:hypothetical protein
VPKIANAEPFTPNVTFVSNDDAFEPTVTKILTATIVIRDGKGGQACFDISEMNDLAKQIVSLQQSDAGPVKVLDLTHATEV